MKHCGAKRSANGSCGACDDNAPHVLVPLYIRLYKFLMNVVSHSDSLISVRLPRAIVETLLQRIHTGTLVILQEDGERRTYGRGEPVALVEVASERVWQALLRGSRGWPIPTLRGCGTPRTWWR